MIAIDSETEAVLGLIDTKIWTRSDEFDATSARERTVEDKESMRFPLHRPETCSESNQFITDRCNSRIEP
ncbi:hypothetical protein AA700_0970 [Acidiphilium acidophilum DSM 700]|uniref:Uncharacterized protein n=1 Tax=Acidiphilium acidophilum TaxID=76588 RepID=A0AAW9DVA1_ACIAO|nr:hypothetical protein [Acidiphilium acidophilum]GBQ09435.1 hypothetical protein AA700_0970 [Acidiphilium acidophilum DSM 700]